MHALRTGPVFRFLRSRGFRLALLAFQFLWLNIIVPGHRRGIVTLPGTECPACEGQAAQSVEPVQPVRACCRNHSKTPPASPIDKANHCAICFFAARLSPAVAFDFSHPPLQFVGFCAVEPAWVSHCPHLHLTYLGRAPPTEA